MNISIHTTYAFRGWIIRRSLNYKISSNPHNYSRYYSTMKQTRLNRNNNSTTKDNDSRILRTDSIFEGIDFDSFFSEDNTSSSKTDTSDIELDREEDDEVIFEGLKEENKDVIDMSDFSDDDSAILAAAARLTEKRDASSPIMSKLKSIKLQPLQSPQQESTAFKHPITKPIQSSKTSPPPLTETTIESESPAISTPTSSPSKGVCKFIIRSPSQKSNTTSPSKLTSPNPINSSPNPKLSPTTGLFNYFPSNAFGTALQQIRFHSKLSKQTSSYSTAAPNEHFDYDHHQPRFYEMTQRPGRDSLDTIEPIRHVGLANKIKEVHTFSKKQEEVLQKVKRGVSLFFTGSAGTGKSVLLKKMISELRKIYPDQVAVTASTGLAACNIGGQTLHSFAGIGLGTGDKESLVKKVRSSRKASARWKAIRVLIVDEISMVDGHLLDKLNHVAKKIRKSNLPFGGIQVVLSGDFYQLPPVVKQVDNRGEEILEKLEPYFAFESAAWEEIIQDIVVLDEVFRQKGDQGFIDMLNEMRDGIVSESAIKKFRVLERPLPNHDGITAAELYATRFEVERANKRRLDQLPGMEVTYPAFDSGTLPEPQRLNLLQNFLAPWDLHLKKDAQVMCIKNFDETLVNGSLGKIVNFVDRETYLSTGNTNPDDKSKTVYNAPVESEDKEQPDLSDYIFHGMVETTGDFSLPEEEKKNRDRKAAAYKAYTQRFKGTRCPLVKFLAPDGVNTRTVLVEPEQWTVEDEEGNVLVSRIQFPLILAWSLSIHKSQGQTLARVKVDLRRIFETGQAYVALSRAVSRLGLQVLNFNEGKVRSHPKVIAFYNSLSTGEWYKGVGPRQQTLGFEREEVEVSIDR